MYAGHLEVFLTFCDHQGVKTFSPTLVNKCIEYFKRVHNTEISTDTANEYLRSFAKLFLAFSERQETDSAGLLMKPDEAVSARFLSKMEPLISKK